MGAGPVKLTVLVTAGMLSFGGVAAAASRGPDPTGPARYGLCKAYANAKGKGAQHKRDATSFVALTDAAADAGQSVADFCEDATPANKTARSSSRGQGETAAGKAKSKAGQHGKP